MVEEALEYLKDGDTILKNFTKIWATDQMEKLWKEKTITMDIIKETANGLHIKNKQIIRGTINDT